MKLTSSLKLALLAVGTAVALPAQPEATPPPAAPAAPAAEAKTFTEPQLLETLGWFVGRRIGLSELGFSEEQTDQIIKGLRLAAAGKEAPQNIDEIGPQLDAFMQGKQAEYTAKLRKVADAENEKFFAGLKDKKGNVTLPSGLVYELITEGSGEFPKPTDIVKVHYTGTLINGTKFDSSVDRGEPAEFPLNGVIPGWTEGLQKLKKGGKIKLYVPYQLAYGEEGRPPTIPPAATLIFDVELLDIKAPPAEAPAAPEGAAPASINGM